MNLNSIHRTITNRIPDEQGGGWEFWCAECSYRVRYAHPASPGEQQLQIIDAGDPTARHTSQSIEDPLDEAFSPFDERPAPDDVSLPVESFDERTWLTPELRAALAPIIARLDDKHP